MMIAPTDPPLPLKAILRIHEREIERYGGTLGVRDEGLLESAVMAPLFAALYEDAGIPKQAAALLYALCKNHPFLDGNKRTATIAALALSMHYGYVLRPEITNAQLAQLTLSVADGSLSKAELTAFFEENLIPQAF